MRELPALRRGGTTRINRLPADGLTRKRYLDFLLRGERQAALELVQRRHPHRNGHQGDLAARVPGLAVRGRPPVAVQQDKHRPGALLHRRDADDMSQLYSHIFSGPRRGRVLVTACAPGEIHELGMRMVADFFEMEGWDTYHLGANCRPRRWSLIVAQRQPDLLGLSATMTFHLEGVAAMVRALRANQETRGVRIMVGGHAFNREPELWRDIGADGYARDAESALTAAERLPAGAEG